MFCLKHFKLLCKIYLMRQVNTFNTYVSETSKTLQLYLNEIGKYDLLTAEQEVELAVKIKQGDQKALNTLVNSNLKFVVSIAKQYQNKGVALLDLINEGNLGLVKAAKKFDPTRGFKFITYAVWWVRDSLQKIVNTQRYVVNLPTNKLTLLNCCKDFEKSFEQLNYRKPSVNEISEHLQCDFKMLSHVKNFKPVRISDNLKEVEKCRNNILDPYSIDDHDKTTYLQHILHKLPDIQADILQFRFGIGLKHPVSLENLSYIFNTTTCSIKFIEKQALSKIKDLINLNNL